VAAVKHSLVVLFSTKEEELFLLTVPVSPDTLKNSSAVVKEIGHDTKLGFFQRDKLLMKIGV